MTKKTIGLLKWAAVLLVAAVIIVDAIYDRIKYIDTYGPRAILYDAEGAAADQNGVVGTLILLIDSQGKISVITLPTTSERMFEMIDKALAPPEPETPKEG